MGIEKLLARLEGIRRNGPDRYMARCPAHLDKSPSLSIRTMADGRILLHDFGGCETGDILAAIGLTLNDLFPARPTNDHYAPERLPFAPRDFFTALYGEAIYLLVVANHLQKGEALNANAIDRLATSCARLSNALAIFEREKYK